MVPKVRFNLVEVLEGGSSPESGEHSIDQSDQEAEGFLVLERLYLSS